MKSDVIEINNKAITMDRMFEQVEKVAQFNKLNKKDAIRLRLLTEECIGIMKGLLGFVKCEMYIENDKDIYKIHVKSDVHVDMETQQKFVELSKDRTNTAYRGFSGMIKRIMDGFVNSPVMPVSGDMTYMPMDAYNTMFANDISEYDNIWDWNEYKDSDAGKTEDWDELEKSVVVNLANNILVAARANSVEMVIVKKFL